MNWEPVNRHWAFDGLDLDRVRTRLPKCLVAAKTEAGVLRLLSLIEEMDRVCDWVGWTETAYRQAR